MEIEIERVEDMAEGAAVLARFHRTGFYRTVYARRQCPEPTAAAVSAARGGAEPPAAGDRRLAGAAAAVSGPHNGAADQVDAVGDAPETSPGRWGARVATDDDVDRDAGEANGADDQLPGADVGDQVDDPDPAPAGALALLEQPGVEDLLQRFLNRRKASTIEAYRKDLTHFAGWLGLPLRDAVARLLACDQGQANRLLDHYAGHMRSTSPAPGSGSSAPRLSPATVNRRLAAIRSLVKMARLHGLVAWTIDVEGERVEPYRDTRGPGRPAVRRMVDQLDEAEGWRRPKAARDRALLRLMWDLGLRRGELVEFDLEHLDVEAGRLSVLGKGRAERVWLDLPEETLEALELWLIHRGQEPGPLFCSVGKGGRVRLNRMSGTDVYRQVRPLGERIGARARPHGVRHSSITGVLEASGGDRRLAQTFARHRDGRVTDRYDDARQNLGGKAARLAASLL
jgi:integrase/recombinase XerC